MGVHEERRCVEHANMPSSMHVVVVMSAWIPRHEIECDCHRGINST